MEPQSLGDRLKEARVAKKLRQYELAKLVGVSHVRISQWEAGTYKPTAENLEKLSSALGRSMGWLLKGTGKVELIADVSPGTLRVMEDSKRYGPPQAAITGQKVEILKRELLRAGAEDPEIDFLEETFRRPETSALIYGGADGKQVAAETAEANLDALLEGVRSIITRRIERRRKKP